MFDASAFQLLLTLLNGWLDRHERDAFGIYSKRIVRFAGSVGADACS